MGPSSTMFAPLAIDQTIRPFLPDLERFETVQELERSGLYRKLKPDIDRLLSHVWHEQIAPPDQPAADSIRALAWNIERGIRLNSVIAVLREHPTLCNADVILLSELDWGMARTENRF